LKTIYKIIFLVTLFSCSQQVDQKQVENNKKQDNPISVDVKANTREIAIRDRPSANFIVLVKYMDSYSYHADSLMESKMKLMIDGLPFTKVKYTDHLLHTLLADSSVFQDGSRAISGAFFSPDHDRNFGKVKTIWTYSWRIPDTEEGLRRQGTVEEWFFDSEEMARYAYQFLIAEYAFIGFPFCKTAPFYLCCGPRLYLFHSDHTGVSYRHKKFHQWLKERC